MNDFSIQKEKAKEKMMEAMLEYAGACNAENIANEMQAEDKFEEQVAFPYELDTKIKKLITQYERKEYIKKSWKTTLKLFPKVSVVFFTVFISFIILLTSVQAVRVKFLNFIIQIEKEFTSIDLKEKKADNSLKDVSGLPMEWENVYIPEYIPEGYKISKAESLVSTKIIHYSNEKNQIIVFTQYHNENTNLRIDTENAKIDKVVINGFDGLLVEKNGTFTIAWHNNDSTFSLMSNVDKSILIKMAESIKLRK